LKKGWDDSINSSVYNPPTDIFFHVENDM